MKISNFIAVIAITISSISVKAQFINAELQVSGLTCSMCQLATQKSLKTLSFISDIKPDLNTNTFVLVFKKDKQVDLELVKKKVRDAGFSVSKLVTVFKFNQLNISNNFHYSYGGNIYHFMNVSNKTLDGEVRLTVISNGFLPAAAYKNYAAQTTYPCYKTGLMGKDRVFHVTI